MTALDYLQAVDTSSFRGLRRLQLPAGSGTQKPTGNGIFPLLYPVFFCGISRQLQPNQTDKTADKCLVLVKGNFQSGGKESIWGSSRAKNLIGGRCEVEK